jgi:hypothetical protein
MASIVGGAEGTLTGTFFAVFYFQGLAGCGLSFGVLAFDANVTVVSQSHTVACADTFCWLR